MLSGDFLRKLKKLNKNLTVLCGDDDTKPAGLYLMFYGEPIHICGVDRNFVPEFPMTDEKGHIIRGGWRRVLNILVAKRLIDKRQAEKVFRTEIKRLNMVINIEEDTTYRAMKEITQRRMEKQGGAAYDKEGRLVPVYRRQDFMDWRDVMREARR